MGSIIDAEKLQNIKFIKVDKEQKIKYLILSISNNLEASKNYGIEAQKKLKELEYLMRKTNDRDSNI